MRQKRESKADRIARQQQIEQDLPNTSIQDRKPIQKMNIHTIAASNFKGKNIAVTFSSAITMIVGRNFAGKTAILQAIKLGLLGFIPGLSKRARDIFMALSSGRSMAIQLNVGGTHLIEHAWVMDKDKVSYDHRPAAGLPETPLVVLDAKSYFEMPAQERIGMIFKTMQLDNSNIQQRIADIARDFERGNMEGPARTLREVITTHGDRFQDWLERALVRIGEMEKENKAAAERMQKTVQGLAHLENQSVAAPAAQLRQQLEAARADLEKLVMDHAAARKPFELANNQAQQRARHTALIQRYEPLAAGYENAQAEYDKENALLNPNGPPVLREVREKLLQARADHNDAVNRAAIATEALAEFEADMKALAAKPKCPTCRRKFAGKMNAEAQAEIDEERAKLEVAVKEKTAAIKKAATAKDRAQKAHDDLLAEAEQYTAIHARVMEAKIKLDHGKSAKEQLEESRQVMATLGVVETSQDGAEEAQRLAEAIDEKRESITKLEGDIRTADMAAGGVKRLTDARQEAERHTVLAKSYKGALKALQERREAFIAEAFKPLLKVCNLFGQEIMITPLEYHDGELGRRREDGGWISMVAFSGAEEAITYAAINAALGATSPARIVLMDEMGKIDVPNKVQLMRNVRDAIEQKVIHQFIGIDVDPTAYERVNADSHDADPEAKKVVEILAIQ